jgi:type III secretion protein U
MADEGGEKTEMPTPKKLRDARNKGQVCTSKDIVSTACLIVLFCLLAMCGKMLIDDFSALSTYVAERIGEDPIRTVSGGVSFSTIIILKHSFIYAGVAALIGIIGSIAQTGFLFTVEPIKPDLNKVNPAEGFKKIFNKKNFFEFFKNIIKVSFLTYLVWKIIAASIPELLTMCYGTLDEITPCIIQMLKRLAVYTAFGYVLIAVVDRIFQGKAYLKDMMMTKDEVKREYKEMEGSAEVKQAQRQFRDELLNGPDPIKATKKANVVVTNPTHLAIGVRYDISESPMPKIVVAGADHIAKIIRETAQAEGIPIMENVPLARALWEKGKVDDFIPVDLVEPVAQVLKWVKSLEEARREEEELDSVQIV